MHWHFVDVFLMVPIVWRPRALLVTLLCLIYPPCWCRGLLNAYLRHRRETQERQRTQITNRFSRKNVAPSSFAKMHQFFYTNYQELQIKALFSFLAILAQETYQLYYLYVAARRSWPWQSWMKVHLGKTVQTAPSEENEQAQFSENVF